MLGKKTFVEYCFVSIWSVCLTLYALIVYLKFPFVYDIGSFVNR